MYRIWTLYETDVYSYEGGGWVEYTGGGSGRGTGQRPTPGIWIERDLGPYNTPGEAWDAMVQDLADEEKAWRIEGDQATDPGRAGKIKFANNPLFVPETDMLAWRRIVRMDGSHGVQMCIKEVV